MLGVALALPTSLLLIPKRAAPSSDLRDFDPSFKKVKFTQVHGHRDKEGAGALGSPKHAWLYVVKAWM